MNFAKYKKYNGKERLLIGSVELQKEDCLSISKLGKNYYIDLVINKKCYSYIKAPSSSILYTMDEDGNKRSASVFALDIN